MDIQGMVANRGRIALVLASALGAVLAGLADRLTKGGASATRSIAEMLWQDFHIGNQPEQGYAMLFLIVIAALVAVVFDPATKKAAFGIGVGLLTSGFTAIPYVEKAAIPEIPSAITSVESPGVSLLDRLTGTTPAWAQPGEGSGSAHLVVEWTGSVRECTLTILSLDRRRVVGRSRYVGRSDFTMRLPAGLYRLSVEAPGSGAAQGEFRIVAGRTSQLRVRLGPKSSLQQVR